MSVFISLIPAALAQNFPERSVTLTTGVRIAWTEVFMNITGFLAASAVGVCSLIFLLGASQLVISHGDQTKVDNGKKMMTGALMGLAIVLGSYGILRTVIFFLYAGDA